MTFQLSPLNICIKSVRLVPVKNQISRFSALHKYVLLMPDQNKCARCVIFIPNFVHCFNYSTLSKVDTSQPFAYYEILGIKRDAKQSEVKQAYFKLAKVYHPDVNHEDDARATFDKITEAYTTLIDLTQRYFYDQHGVACEELRKRGSNSTIFDWVPKYSIYEHQMRADGETSEVEDWFKAQGHQGFDAPRISIRQRMKNAYVEFRYGLSYYNFPWEWKAFIGGLIAWVAFLFACLQALNYGYKSVSYRKPVPINFKWENDDIYDILWYAGARRNKSDKTRRSGLRFPTNSQGKTLCPYFSITPSPSLHFTFLVLFLFALQASRPNPRWPELGCTTCPREPSRPPSTVTPSTATPGAGPRRRT